MVATASAPPIALPRASVHVSVRPAVDPDAVHAAVVEVALVADRDIKVSPAAFRRNHRGASLRGEKSQYVFEVVSFGGKSKSITRQSSTQFCAVHEATGFMI